jgi:hypothetical protein
MTDFTWVIHDENGKVLRSTESFATQREAEDWMGKHWSGLVEEGGAAVSLISGRETIYEMGLGEA